MIVIIRKRKKRLVMKAIANLVLMCTTNQNGKTAFNHKAANAVGITLPELEELHKIGMRFHKKLNDKKSPVPKAKMEVVK